MSDYTDTEDQSSGSSFEPSESESRSSDNNSPSESDIDEALEEVHHDVERQLSTDEGSNPQTSGRGGSTSHSSYKPSHNASMSSKYRWANQDDINENPTQGHKKLETQLSGQAGGTPETGTPDVEPSVFQIQAVGHSPHEQPYLFERRLRASRPRQLAEKTVMRQRRTVYCFFCEQPVLQFARHLTRQHALEIEVQRITAYKKNSKKRKRLISVLRNKGNYLRAKATNTLTPVRRPMLPRANSEPLPCTHCYGLYARKQLWRHVKQCVAKNSNEQPPSNYQNIAQNLLLSHVQGNKYLTENVFPRMRADNVTLAVKADPLICAFGSRFAKTHHDAHQVNLVSRRMRELGRLVIELKHGHQDIKTLVDALKPEHYNLLVECTKAVAGCDDESQQYKSPTLAMNMQTTLKECCEVACNFLYQHGNFMDKNAYDEAEFPFRRLTATITANWRFDVSHDAAHSLNTAGMNKVTIVPMASDLQKFRQYLTQSALDSVLTLQHDGTDVQAFKNLTETIYCRVMLLCRKRPGELSRLTVELYNKSGGRQSYEEFAEVIRPSEMVLVRRFKRVVIHGKRKPTPVIFTDDVQDHIQTMLEVRGNFLSKNNPFLFGNPTTTTPIPGYKVIKKHALRASLSRPEAITTRCLRKHLATVCQVLSMTEQDIEQLAGFMGHGVGVHRSEYRLPDDVFQVAKVAKLLMMMETGRAAQFKGKTLDEIELNMDEDVLIEAEQHARDDIEPPGPVIDKYNEEDNDMGADKPATPNRVPAVTPNSRTVTRPKKFDRVLWTDDQKRLMARRFFERHIKDRIAPQRGECEALIAAHPHIFVNKSWQKIKVYIANQYTKKKLSF